MPEPVLFLKPRVIAVNREAANGEANRGGFTALRQQGTRCVKNAKETRKEFLVLPAGLVPMSTAGRDYFRALRSYSENMGSNEAWPA